MGFNAGTVTEPMDWDFTAFGTPDDKGTVPEPTIEQADLFQQQYVSLLQTLMSIQQNARIEGAVENANRAHAAITELADALPTGAAPRTPIDDLDAWAQESRIPKEEAQRVNDEMIRICAEICSGSPNEAQIRLLPSRPFRAFMAWLMEQISDPKFNHGESATSSSPDLATSASSSTSSADA